MNSVKFCCVEGMDSVLEVLAGSCLQCLRGVSFWEGLAVFWWGRCLQCFGGHLQCCSVLEGRCILEKPLAVFGGVWHFWRALAVFWRGVEFLEGACSVMEGVAFLEGACRVLEGCGILEKPLVVVWRSAAFLEGACSVMEGCLRSFGGMWHFWRRLQHFGGA